jgi:hypothetical protein
VERPRIKNAPKNNRRIVWPNEMELSHGYRCKTMRRECVNAV